MKRRQAIRHLAIATAAAYLLPQCKPEPTATGPGYSNLPLDADGRKLLDGYLEALLPKAGTGVMTPEATGDFVLAVLNDCHSREDAGKFASGLGELQAHVARQYKSDFGKLTAAQQGEVLAWLAKPEGLSEPLRFFAETARSLAIEHFTTSEFFLKNVQGWAFAPGYFKGCVAV
jgi:hypothetical protein